MPVETLCSNAETQNQESIKLDENSINDFLNFLKDKSEYLDSGLEVFHTDDHSNW